MIVITVGLVTFILAYYIIDRKDKKEKQLQERLAYLVNESYEAKHEMEDLLSSEKSIKDKNAFQAQLIIYSYICCDFSVGPCNSKKEVKILAILYGLIIESHLHNFYGTQKRYICDYIKKYGGEILLNYQNAIKNFHRNPDVGVENIGRTIFAQIIMNYTSRFNLYIDLPENDFLYYHDLGEIFIDRVKMINAGL